VRGSEVRDKTLIEAALRRDVGWHVYHLGDLDDELYPYTRWFATFDGAEIDRLALFFDRYAPPILLALTNDVDRMVEMLQDMGDLFPRRMHAHLSPGVVEALRPEFEPLSAAPHLRMQLTKPDALHDISPRDTSRPTSDDLPALHALYEHVYAGEEGGANVFHELMLDLGPYYGVYQGRELVAAAGVHVCSAEHGVAAVANVATHPQQRGRRLAQRVTAAVCRELLPIAETIGLNVCADNVPAVAAYRRLGFDAAFEYEEMELRRVSPPAAPAHPPPDA
jgi:ribosomal protein S18 acetylase RimI-like enzyme